MKRLLRFTLLFLILGGGWSHGLAYDYPLKDPYLATVIGTPAELQPTLPEKIDLAQLLDLVSEYLHLDCIYDPPFTTCPYLLK